MRVRPRDDHDRTLVGDGAGEEARDRVEQLDVVDVEADGVVRLGVLVVVIDWVGCRQSLTLLSTTDRANEVTGDARRPNR